MLAGGSVEGADVTEFDVTKFDPVETDAGFFVSRAVGLVRILGCDVGSGWVVSRPGARVSGCLLWMSPAGVVGLSVAAGVDVDLSVSLFCNSGVGVVGFLVPPTWLSV
jgi:hypothetical protein